MFRCLVLYIALDCIVWCYHTWWIKDYHFSHNSNEEWIACQLCGTWYHEICADAMFRVQTMC